MQEGADGRSRDGSAPGGRRLLGPVALISALALAAFAVSFVATFPAKVAATYTAMPVQFNAYSGTVWNGTASLPGGHRLAWRLAPLRSLAALRPEAAARLTGPGTSLAGTVGLGRRLDLAGVSGSLAWPAVAAVLPGLGASCDLTAEVEEVALATGPGGRTASGLVRTGAGSCGLAGAEPLALPALVGRLETVEGAPRLAVAAADRPEATLGSIGFGAGGLLLATVTDEGAALLPPGAAAGGMTLTVPLGR